MIRIIKAQIITDLSHLAGDTEAGLYSPAEAIRALDKIRIKMLAWEAHEDAINDIRENEPERRAEAQAEEVEQRRDAYREEEMAEQL